MKYKILSVFASFVLIFTFSCTTKFLDLYPISSQTTGTFYKTQKDFDQALNACYKELQDHYDAYSTTEYILEAKSDDVMPGPYGSLDIARFLDDATNSTTAAFWKKSFEVINTCNQLITYIDGAEEEISDKETMVAEARFIRGIVYFDMVRLFGGMPLYDKAYNLDEYYTIARSSIDETYEFIYSDFQTAAEVLPANYTGANVGRATSFAAKGFLGKAYLTNQKYSEALELFNQITSSPNYGFYNDWLQIWDEANDNGQQALFQIQFITGSTNRDQGCQYLTYCAAEGVAIGDLADKKYPLGGASPSMLVSQDLYDSYEDGDIRRDLTICSEYMTKQNVLNTSTFFVWKFTHKAIIPSLTEDWGLNRTLLRYTDILMMKAECINQISGPISEAVNIVNMVRTRAGLADLAAEETSSKDSFLQAIVKERRHEFAFENQRWFDLLRWGIAEDVMNSFLADMEVNVPHEMKSYQNLYPIPAEQIEIIGDETVLSQNPGY